MMNHWPRFAFPTAATAFGIFLPNLIRSLLLGLFLNLTALCSHLDSRFLPVLVRLWRRHRSVSQFLHWSSVAVDWIGLSYDDTSGKPSPEGMCSVFVGSIRIPFILGRIHVPYEMTLPSLIKVGKALKLAFPAILAPGRDHVT